MSPQLRDVLPPLPGTPYAEGQVIEARGGKYTVTTTNPERVTFTFEDAAGQKTPGTLPIAIFQKMTGQALAADQKQHAPVETRPRRAECLTPTSGPEGMIRKPSQFREALLGLLGYAVIALLLMLRGLDYWWYWPAYFGWQYFQNF